MSDDMLFAPSEVRDRKKRDGQDVFVRFMRRWFTPVALVWLVFVFVVFGVAHRRRLVEEAAQTPMSADGRLNESPVPSVTLLPSQTPTSLRGEMAVETQPSRATDTVSPVPTKTVAPVPTNRRGEMAHTSTPSRATPLPSETPLPSPTPDYEAIEDARLTQSWVAFDDQQEQWRRQEALKLELRRYAGIGGIVVVTTFLLGIVLWLLLNLWSSGELDDGAESLDPAWREGQGDAPISRKAPEEEWVRLELKSENRKLWSKYPVEKRVLRQWAQVALNGGSIAIRRWAGDDKPFSRAEYEKFIEYWLEGGVLKDKYEGMENSERIVTEPGKEVLKAILVELGGV